jgi:hypothetical protein
MGYRSAMMIAVALGVAPAAFAQSGPPASPPATAPSSTPSSQPDTTGPAQPSADQKQAHSGQHHHHHQKPGDDSDNSHPKQQ